MIMRYAAGAWLRTAPTPCSSTWRAPLLARAGCLATLVLGACGSLPKLHLETFGGGVTSE